MKFSKKILAIKPSATVSISNKAKLMRAEGKPVLSFSLGEPDFNAPEAAKNAAIDAVKRNESHYTLNPGIIELRKAISTYYKNRFGIEYGTDEILVAPGAKPILCEALTALLDEGDEVILFAPTWVSYVEQIHLAGGVEKVVDTARTNLVPAREDLISAISDRTVGIILNTPSNPTGAVYDEETLKMIAEVARTHDLWIIFDEIYERLVYAPARHINILNVAPEIRDRVILVNGASKTYAMTGLRIGYALAPKAVISKMASMQTHLTGNACSVAQWATYGAIIGSEDDVEKMRLSFEHRRNVILDLIRSMPYVHVSEPQGAFYVFVDIRECPIPDDVTFCEKLLEEKFVATVPGSAFFAPGFVRISYASSEENIIEGMKRMKEFLESIKK